MSDINKNDLQHPFFHFLLTLLIIITTKLKRSTRGKMQWKNNYWYNNQYKIKDRNEIENGNKIKVEKEQK